MWMLSRWEDIRSVSRQPALFSTAHGVLLNDRLPRAGTKQAARYAPKNESIIHLDPPRHGQVRKLVREAFTARRVAALEPWMREMCREQLAALPRGEPVDLVAEIAAPIPAMTIARILGVPRERWRHWQECANAMIEVAAGDPEATTPPPATMAKLGELAVTLKKLVEERRRAPEDDLLTALLQVERAGLRFDDGDVLMMALTLLGAGNETTRTLVAGACLALHEHPEQWRRLAADPRLVPDAVEEFLRFVTPVHSHARTAMEDCVIRGQPIRQGDYLVMLYAAGNRDEEVWTEPDRFDVSRPARSNPHLSFGHGEHFCLGASLARLEARVVFEELLRAFSRFELAAPPRKLRSTHINGIEEMPVLLS